jgi:hypothetical protein
VGLAVGVGASFNQLHCEIIFCRAFGPSFGARLLTDKFA